MLLVKGVREHAVTEGPPPPNAVARARSIVIVEDNPSVATTLEAALQQAGHVVHLFADAPSALAGVAGLKPDAFVIDIGLPGMDGYELATTLQQRATTTNAVRIAVSGFKRRDPAAGGDAFDHYFNKPVDVPALLALLS